LRAVVALLTEREDRFRLERIVLDEEQTDHARAGIGALGEELAVGELRWLTSLVRTTNPTARRLELPLYQSLVPHQPPSRQINAITGRLR
jgi:hypothetical protein